MQPSIETLGDTAAIVKWDGLTSAESLLHVYSLSSSLQAARIPGFEAFVPAFASLTVHYDPYSIDWALVEDSLRKRVLELTPAARVQGKLVEIPVCYDLEFAVDLSELALQHGMPIKEVVRLHSTADYVVQMIGFAPGFPYLAGLPSKLETARKSTPRLRVPSGSVAIGGKQTGIYSLETPGGWNIIGRTPVALFQPQNDPPCLLIAGDRVRFVSITMNEFLGQRGSS